MTPARIVQISRAQDAAEALVAALREHDLEGAALHRAMVVSRLLRAWLTNDRAGDPFALDRGIVRLRSLCVSRRLHHVAPVRRALTAFTVSAESARGE